MESSIQVGGKIKQRAGVEKHRSHSGWCVKHQTRNLELPRCAIGAPEVRVFDAPGMTLVALVKS